jgi:hypothetical protein
MLNPRHPRALWAIAASVGGVLFSLSGCSPSTSRSPSAACTATRTLEKVQAGLTPTSEIAYGRPQLERSFAMQAAAQQNIERHAPIPVAASYAHQLYIEKAIAQIELDAWPTNGNGLALRAEALAAGFPTIAQYLTRDGIRLPDGSVTTWANYITLRDANFQALTNSCPELRSPASGTLS